jgi:hypothetical protein
MSVMTVAFRFEEIDASIRLPDQVPEVHPLPSIRLSKD